MDDLDSAIAANEQAVELTPKDHSNRSMYLNNLGIALRTESIRENRIDERP